MKITEKVHQLKINFTITINDQIKIPRFVNVLIIFDEQITLIDTGVSGSEELIFEYIKSQNRDIEEISTILLSHSHPDHIGAAYNIRKATGCKVACNLNEQNWIENIKLQNEERPVPGFFNLVKNSCGIDFNFYDNQLLTLGKSTTVKCLSTPGHSIGSTCFLFENEHVLFTGDAIPLKNDIPNYDDYTQLLKSLEIIEQLAQDNLIITSWTPPLIEADEKTKKINEGKEYINKIDTLVNEVYSNHSINEFGNCKTVIEKLGLPPFLNTPLVNKTLKSHLL